MNIKPIRALRPPSVGWQAALVAAVGYGSAIIANLVSANASPTLRFWLLVCGGLIACVLMALAAALVQALSRAHRERLERENATHRSGYQTLSREISKYTGLARELRPADPEAAKAVVDLMFSACRDLHDTLETEYGLKASISDHIEFEVTFMTVSLRDGEITIAAWANRDGRAPKSLAAREKDPKVYEGTETFLLYHDENRTPRFIESTDGTAYKELYPGQKRRIKSSVIWPVVDDRFDLLGTLVVHCDRERFFSPDNEKLWRETLEPYTKRLALARAFADRLAETSRAPQF